MEKSLIEFFQFIHQSIEKASVEFLNKMRRHFYVTPTSYLELLSTYSKVLHFKLATNLEIHKFKFETGKVLLMKRKEIGTLRDRLSIGVDVIVSTEKQAIVCIVLLSVVYICILLYLYR